MIKLDLNINNNIETIDNNNSKNGKIHQCQSDNELLTENNSDNMMQIQKQQLDSKHINNNTTYESIENHNNKYNKIKLKIILSK